MTRYRDADKALARGSAAGTRGGKPISFQSRPPAREPVARPEPPAHALAVLRPPALPVWLNLPWLLAAIAVGVVYGATLHQIPWLLVLLPVGRTIRSLVVRSGHWIALTPGSLEGRDGNDGWSVSPAHVVSIAVDLDRVRIELLDARGRKLASVAPVYTRRQVEKLADALGVRVVER